MRTGSGQLLDEFLELATTAEDRTEAARCAYMHDRIDEEIVSDKGFWQEMRKLGLIPTTREALHGILLYELHDHFTNICVSPLGVPQIWFIPPRIKQILNAPPEGFQFKSVSVNDVILVVSHFRSRPEERMRFHTVSSPRLCQSSLMLLLQYRSDLTAVHVISFVSEI